MAKYEIVNMGERDGWLDRQLRKIEEDVAKWPAWMRERGDEYPNAGNAVHMENYKKSRRD